MQILTFQLGGADFGVRLKDVFLVENNRNIIRTSANSKYVKGYVFLRKRIIPVYDLALRFAYMEQEMSYLVVVSLGKNCVGFEVHGINQIVDVEENEFIPTPSAVSRAKRYFPDVIYIREQIIFMLDMDQLIPQREKREIDHWVRSLEENQ